MIKKDSVSGVGVETGYLVRYTGSGIVNTVVGFFVILSAMAIGFTPVVSNVAGYAVGFTLGFVLSKKFVFRSNGHFVNESIRYLIAFIVSYALNLAVLYLAISYFNIHAVISQFVAAIAYTLCMYILARFFVFGIK